MRLKLLGFEAPATGSKAHPPSSAPGPPSLTTEAAHGAAGPGGQEHGLGTLGHLSEPLEGAVTRAFCVVVRPPGQCCACLSGAALPGPESRGYAGDWKQLWQSWRPAWSRAAGRERWGQRGRGVRGQANRWLGKVLSPGKEQGSLVPVGLLEQGTFCVLGMLVTYTGSRPQESQQRLCRNGREVTFAQ